MKKEVKFRKAKYSQIAEWDREEIENLLPELSREMDEGSSSRSLREVLGSRTEQAPRPAGRPTSTAAKQQELTNPDAVAFIRRCSRPEEAIEIIDFLLQRGEISPDISQEYKHQLETQGLESFGSKKEPGLVPGGSLF